MAATTVQPVLAFCHLRKTGGITFNQILRREFGLQHLDAITRYPGGANIYRGQDLNLDRWIYPRLKSIAGHGVRPFLDYGEFSKRMRWLTILRTPADRYVSHFIHHVEHFGYSESFPTWMKIEKHQNDQTKTIAGETDIVKAKQLLYEFYWVGFTEDYLESMQMLGSRMEGSFSTHYDRPSNVATGTKVDKQDLLFKYANEILNRNELDVELHEFAREEIWSRQKQWSQSANTSVRKSRFGVLPSRVKRNAVYKPFMKLSLKLSRFWNRP